MQDSNTCIFYDQSAETIDHILLGCSYAKEVWDSWLRKLHLHEVVVPHNQKQAITAITWCLHSMKQVLKTIRRGFDSLFFLFGWMIWKERNARTFNGATTSVVQLSGLVQPEFDEWRIAGFIICRPFCPSNCGIPLVVVKSVT